MEGLSDDDTEKQRRQNEICQHSVQQIKRKRSPAVPLAAASATQDIAFHSSKF
jgi:hypothetical protein